MLASKGDGQREKSTTSACGINSSRRTIWAKSRFDQRSISVVVHPLALRQCHAGLAQQQPPQAAPAAVPPPGNAAPPAWAAPPPGNAAPPAGGPVPQPGPRFVNSVYWPWHRPAHWVDPQGSHWFRENIPALEILTDGVLRAAWRGYSEHCENYIATDRLSYGSDIDLQEALKGKGWELGRSGSGVWRNARCPACREKHSNFFRRSTR